MAAPKFTEQEREQQRNDAIRHWMEGLTVREIAEKLSESAGQYVSHDTAHRRLNEAKDAMRPTADYEQYLSDAMVEIDAARRQLRREIALFEHGDRIGDLALAVRVLLSLQDQAHKLTGVDQFHPELVELMQISEAELEAIVNDWHATNAEPRPSMSDPGGMMEDQADTTPTQEAAQ